MQTDVLERIIRGDPLAVALEQLIRWIETASADPVAGSILLLEDGTRLCHCAAPSLPGAYTSAIDGLVIGPGVGSCGTAAFTAAPVVVTDVATDPRWNDFRHLALPHGLRACWSTPILDGAGDVLGTFAMYAREPRGPSAADDELVRLCVRTASVAISHARVEAGERRTRERLRLALAAGGLGAWEWDVHRGSIIWDATLEAIYGFEPGQFSGSLEEYRGRIHPDDLEHHASVLAAARTAAEPYTIEHRIVRPDGSVRWTRGWATPRFDEHGLTGYTGVVADITEDKDAEQERSRLVDRLATTARTLQRSLLPPVPPQIPDLEVATAYRPGADGMEVGGDFYDLAPVGRNAWAFVFGDVCGKGAEAAALTALVRYAARMAATQVTDPAEILQRVNGMMEGDQSFTDARFATAIFARLRPSPGRLAITFATAGHPLPFVVRANGQVERPGRHGQLLGVLPKIEVHNTRVALGPGDAYVTVTDGVLEARNAQREELGDDLAKVLSRFAGSPAALVVSVIDEAVAEWAPGPLHDDVAVVVLRVPPTDD